MKYSNAGDYVLVIPGTTQPLIYDRDGQNQYVSLLSALICSVHSFISISVTHLPKEIRTFEICVTQSTFLLFSSAP